jgi:endonuclease YncB( thermonuclease family)
VKPLLAFLLLFITAPLQFPETVITARLIGITDGDTVKALAAGNQLLRIRLSWIDAPEKGQPFGQRAKQAMSELVFGREVELRPHSVDRYRRLVAQVLVDDQDAGLELLKQGLCWINERYVSEAPPEIEASYWAAHCAAAPSS